jgi:hypothetical protein
VLRCWNRQRRWRAAIALAALYAFCVLLPSAALAVTHIAAHCLTGSQGASHVHRGAEKTPDRHAGAGHSHAGKAQHEHGNDGAPHRHDETGDEALGGNCCGLFCVSAITQNIGAGPIAVFAASTKSPALADALVGCGPDRLIRPPIR